MHSSHKPIQPQAPVSFYCVRVGCDPVRVSVSQFPGVSVGPTSVWMIWNRRFVMSRLNNGNDDRMLAVTMVNRWPSAAPVPALDWYDICTCSTLVIVLQSADRNVKHHEYVVIHIQWSLNYSDICDQVLFVALVKRYSLHEARSHRQIWVVN